MFLPGLLCEEGRRFFQEIDLHPGLTQLGFDFLVLGELGRRHFLALDAGMGFPPLVHPVSYGLRDQTVGFCHLADRTGLLNDLQHDLLFELFAVLGCGHNTDFTSHVRLNLFFVTVHKTCSTPDLLQENSSTDPSNSNLLGIYAYFLTTIRQDHDQAERLYNQAITINPKDAFNLGTYANFLKNIRHNHDHAEELYEQALAIDPNNTTILGSYANFLKNIRHNHDHAEELYAQALAIDPNNASTLDTYAVFLATIRHNYNQAEKLYKQAIKVDLNNGYSLCYYANFLTYIRHDHDQAEKLYEQAITISPNKASILYTYAIFLTIIRHDHNQAEKLYTQALTIDPNNAITLGNYSQLLFVTGRDEKGAKFAERALGLAERGQEALCAECHFYLFMHSPRHRTASGRALKALLADGVTTGGWSLEGSLERLTQEENPRYELARAVAEALRTGDASALDDFEEWRDLDLPDREE